jgi:hypothetical protein
MASKKSNSRLRYWSNGRPSDMKAGGFTTILVYCVGPPRRADLDRPPPRISAAKNDPRNQRVILLRQAGKNIRAAKITAIDGRDEC